MELSLNMASDQDAPQARRQLLSNDILWLFGKHFLASPSNIRSLAVASQTLYKTLEPEMYIADVLLAKDSAVAYSAICCLICYARHPNYTYCAGGGIIQAIWQKQHRAVEKFIAASLRFWPTYLSGISLPIGVHESVGPFELAIRLRAFDIADMLERAGSDPECVSFMTSTVFLLLYISLSYALWSSC
ncbi:hypothetical protein PG984_003701 [Apiospora sp. TS-2023a]